MLEPELFLSVLCRISYTPKGIKYRAERPPFLLSFGVRPSIHTLPQISTNFAPVFFFFLYFCVCVCGGGDPLRPVGAHSGSETISGRFLMDFCLLLGSPGDHFGGHLGARVSNLERLCRFFGVFCGASKKETKKLPKVIPKGASLFGGGRHGSSVVNSGPN